MIKTKFSPYLSFFNSGIRFAVSLTGMVIWIFFSSRLEDPIETFKALAIASIIGFSLPVGSFGYLCKSEKSERDKLLIISFGIATACFTVAFFTQAKILIVAAIALFYTMERVLIVNYNEKSILQEYFSLSLILRVIAILLLGLTQNISITTVLILECSMRALCFLNWIFKDYKSLREELLNFYDEKILSTNFINFIKGALKGSIGTYFMVSSQWMPLLLLPKDSPPESALLFRIVMTVLSFSAVFYMSNSAQKHAKTKKSGIVRDKGQIALIITFCLSVVILVLAAPFIQRTYLPFMPDSFFELIGLIIKAHIWILLSASLWLLSWYNAIFFEKYTIKKEIYFGLMSFLVSLFIAVLIPYKPHVALFMVSLFNYFIYALYLKIRT